MSSHERNTVSDEKTVDIQNQKRKLERILGKYGSVAIKVVDNITKNPSRYSERSIDYWKDVANKDDIEDTMRYICAGFDKKTFSEKSECFPSFLKDYDLKSKRVMDLACGLGRTCKFIAPKVEEYVGVDFVPKMIEKAKIYNRQFKNANFYVNDGKTLINFKDGD